MDLLSVSCQECEHRERAPDYRWHGSSPGKPSVMLVAQAVGQLKVLLDVGQTLN